MKFYIPAAFPMLYYDDKTVDIFVRYMCSCENEPTPQEVSESTGIPIGICREKVPLVLMLNRCMLKHKNRRKKALEKYLNN